jgi:hypothetical protein
MPGHHQILDVREETNTFRNSPAMKSFIPGWMNLSFTFFETVFLLFSLARPTHYSLALLETDFQGFIRGG